MGKKFGELAFVRGILYYKLSPHEQNPLAGMITHGLPNLVPRTLSRLWTYLPVFILGYVTFVGCDEWYHLKMRKNPKDYANEVPPPPPKVEKCVPKKDTPK